MISKKEYVVVVGKRGPEDTLLHAVRVASVDGKLTEPPMKSLCEQTMHFLTYMHALPTFEERNSNLCKSCRDALKWSEEARKVREKECGQ